MKTLSSYKNFIKSHPETPKFALVFHVDSNKIIENGCSISTALADYGKYTVGSIEILENQFVIGIH